MKREQAEELREIGSTMARAKPPAEAFPPLPDKPTLADVLRLRLHVPRHGLPMAVTSHGIQSASLALEAGCDEEIAFACLVHDIGLGLLCPDHGWFGAQLLQPYVAEKVAWAVRYHQALRFFPDPEVGYEYPDMYVAMFGADFQVPDYIEAAYQEARAHPWYMAARLITLYDDYSFDRSAPIDLDPFIDIIGRHFRQPPEGLGRDSTSVTHMWRTLIDPNKPL